MSIAARSWADHTAMMCLLFVAACAEPESSELEASETKTCWVYKGLSDEEIKRMEERCNAYATCSGEEGDACSVQTEPTAP